MQPHPLALDPCRVGRASHADRAIVPALNDSQNTFCTHTHTHTHSHHVSGSECEAPVLRASGSTHLPGRWVWRGRASPCCPHLPASGRGLVPSPPRHVPTPPTLGPRYRAALGRTPAARGHSRQRRNPGRLPPSVGPQAEHKAKTRGACYPLGTRSSGSREPATYETVLGAEPHHLLPVRIPVASTVGHQHIRFLSDTPGTCKPATIRTARAGAQGKNDVPRGHLR